MIQGSIKRQNYQSTIPIKILINIQKDMFSSPKSECIRCGSCCKKGGPSFHIEDKPLIEKGIIPTKYLYTIRKGELAHDNVKGCLIPIASDIIKIKGRKELWACVFFDEVEKICKIYENRPLECRVLKCWDTKEIKKIYDKNRLIREELVSGIKWIWDMIEEHEKRCSYEKMGRLTKELEIGKTTEETLEDILEVISYDTEIRRLLVSKGGVDPDIIDFLFGRPLTKTIKMFGPEIQLKITSHFHPRS